MNPIFDDLDGTLIVSCQAPAESPLCDPMIMASISQAAVQGGAAAIRANSPQHIAAIRAAVQVPIIGLWKRTFPEMGVRITPTVDDAAALLEAGADIVALDATQRPRPDGNDAAAFIQQVREELGCPVLADIDSLDAAIAAVYAGADAVATTLAGYTGADGSIPEEPDIQLVSDVASAVDAPVLAEGRYRTTMHIREAIEAGARSVIVGAAITDPVRITRRLREGLRSTQARGSSL